MKLAGFTSLGLVCWLLILSIWVIHIVFVFCILNLMYVAADCSVCSLPILSCVPPLFVDCVPPLYYVCVSSLSIVFLSIYLYLLCPSSLLC